MRIFYKLVVLFLIFVSNQIVSIAQTSIDGIINSSIVLEKSKSPYLVTNNLVVFPSGKLTIEPGVELRFANDTKLEIRGELIAKGNKTDSITFKSNTSNSKGSWLGIIIKDDQDGFALFDYCNILHSTTAINGLTDAEPLKNSIFSLNNNVFESVNSWRIIIDSCVFENNDKVHHEPIAIDYSNCIVKNNIIGIGTAGNVRNSVFENNSDYALSCFYMGYDNIVSENTFINNNTAFKCNLDGNVENNLFKENQLAIMVNSNYDVVMEYNVLTNNTIGVQFDKYTSEIILNNNQICDNSEYNILNNTDKDVMINNNCWCEADSNVIVEKIYDGLDSIELGLVNYIPMSENCSFFNTNISTVENLKFELFHEYIVDDQNGRKRGIDEWGQSLSKFGSFGFVNAIGDINGDGIKDLAFSDYSYHTESGGGVIFICFLDEFGDITESIPISVGVNGFNDYYSTYDFIDGQEIAAASFGQQIEGLGDINGDGIPDIAVSAPADRNIASSGKAGSVYILMLNRDGTVKSHQRIGEGEGGLKDWEQNGFFGSSISNIGDVDSDGINDLAVGSSGDTTAGRNISDIARGAIFIIRLNPDGTVKSQNKILPSGILFDGLDPYQLGLKMGCIGDVNGDDNVDLAASVGQDFLIMFLNDKQELENIKYHDRRSYFLSDILRNKENSGRYSNPFRFPDINHDGKDELGLGTNGVVNYKGIFGVFSLGSDGEVKTNDTIDFANIGPGFKESLSLVGSGQYINYLGDINNDGYPEIGYSDVDYDTLNAAGATFIYTVKPYNKCADSCVWPGDSDNDGIVNVKDIMPLGLYFNEEKKESSRIMGSIHWHGQYAQDWGEGSVDKKHSDCNGDGIINRLDKAAIKTNYSRANYKLETPPELDENGPLISLKSNKDSVFTGETVTYEIYLGNEYKSADSIYGLSLSLRHNYLIIPHQIEIIAKFDSSWFGKDSLDLMSIYKSTENGVDIGLVRTDKQNRSGYGKIGEIYVNFSDDVIQSENRPFILNLHDVKMINVNEEVITPNFISDSVELISLLNSKLIVQGINLYPNPTSNILTIVVNDITENVKVYDLQGRLVYSKQPYSKIFTLDLDALDNGQYSVVTRSGSIYRYAMVTKK